MRGKWTEGPWFMSGARQKVGGADTHSVVATVDGKEIIIASVWYNPITHEGFHDTRLIAASPALYEALALAEDVLSRFPFSGEIWPGGTHPNAGIEQIRAALAQARGEQP